jgi:hypothetical protein
MCSLQHQYMKAGISLLIQWDTHYPMRVKGCTNNHLQVIHHMLLDAFTKLNNLLYFFTQQMYIFRSSLLVPHVFMECLLLLITVPIFLVATSYPPPPIYFFGYKNESMTTSGACSQPH